MGEVYSQVVVVEQQKFAAARVPKVVRPQMEWSKLYSSTELSSTAWSTPREISQLLRRHSSHLVADYKVNSLTPGVGYRVSSDL